MIYKKPRLKSLYSAAEIYIFSLLIFSYIIGVCIGCSFVFKNQDNAVFITYIANKSSLKTVLLFLVAIVLKYSGVLSSFICLLPLISGLQNAVYYCTKLQTANSGYIYSSIVLILKDTSIAFLLLLYMTLLICKILSKEFNLKTDIRDFFVYIFGTVCILAIEYGVHMLIF